MLAFHFLLVCLFEWDTLFPETWPLPQISHFLDIYRTSFKYLKLSHNYILIREHSNKWYYTTPKSMVQVFFSYFDNKLLSLLPKYRPSFASGLLHIQNTLIPAAPELKGQILFRLYERAVDQQIRTGKKIGNSGALPG